MNTLRRRIRHSGRRGAVLVEAACVLPALLLVILGTVEFGRAMMVAQMVTTAARDGARVGILPGKTNADVQATVENFMTEAANVSPDKYTLTITVTPASGNPDPYNEVGNATTGDKVKVVVKVPFENVTYISPEWLAGTYLTGKCELRHE